MSTWRRFVRDKSMWAFVLFWICFIYLFWPGGPIGWQDDKMYDRGWWIDTCGHLFSGVIGGWNCIYLFRTYMLYGIFRITGRVIELMFTFSIMNWFALVMWENGEMFYDLGIDDPCKNPALMALMAQKSRLDTFLDALLTGVIGPLIAFGGYWIRDVLYEKCYPEDHRKEHYKNLADNVKGIGEEIEQFRNEHGHHHVRPLIKKFLKSFKQDKKRPK